MSLAHSYLYQGNVLHDQNLKIQDISDHLNQSKSTMWIDFLEPTLEELSEIAQELDLHELAIEDSVHSLQRPKVDYYDSHFFITCHALSLDTQSGMLHPTEINVFIKDNCIITVRKNNRFDMDSVLRRWVNPSHRSDIDVSFMLYGLLDVVVDGYIDIVDKFDEYYDAIGQDIFEDIPLDQVHQKEWFTMRRSLVKFHRMVVSQRESINRLLKREYDLVSVDMHPYFQDIYDHIIRVSESADALRDLMTSIVEANISLRDYRQNQIVKQVTSWAAIVAVPTLITGYYGMNVPYPGSGATSGVIVSTLLMVLCPAWLYIIFKRKNWI